MRREIVRCPTSFPAATNRLSGIISFRLSMRHDIRHAHLAVEHRAGALFEK